MPSSDRTLTRLGRPKCLEDALLPWPEHFFTVTILPPTSFHIGCLLCGHWTLHPFHIADELPAPIDGCGCWWTARPCFLNMQYLPVLIGRATMHSCGVCALCKGPGQQGGGLKSRLLSTCQAGAGCWEAGPPSYLLRPPAHWDVPFSNSQSDSNFWSGFSLLIHVKADGALLAGFVLIQPAFGKEAAHWLFSLSTGFRHMWSRDVTDAGCPLSNASPMWFCCRPQSLSRCVCPGEVWGYGEPAQTAPLAILPWGHLPSAHGKPSTGLWSAECSLCGPVTGPGRMRSLRPARGGAAAWMRWEVQGGVSEGPPRTLKGFPFKSSESLEDIWRC